MNDNSLDRLGYGIVAFADILGFREMVEADSSSRPPKFLPQILEALRELDEELATYDVTVRQFSDSVVLSTGFSPSNFLACVTATRRLQQLLVSRSISVRGGIAFGYHYAEDGRLFSQALVKAYELESSVARFPRVLIDKNLLDAALNHPSIEPSEADRVSQMLMVDRDGQAFIHYLDNDLFAAHETLILSGLCSAMSATGILEKAHWQADYHDWVAAHLEHPKLEVENLSRFSSFSGATQGRSVRV